MKKEKKMPPMCVLNGLHIEKLLRDDGSELKLTEMEATLIAKKYNFHENFLLASFKMLCN